MTDEQLKRIALNAWKREGTTLPDQSGRAVVRIKTSVFKRVGFIMDFDFLVYDLTKKQQEKIGTIFENLFFKGEIEDKDFRNEFKVSKSFARIPCYQDAERGGESEAFILDAVLGVLEGKL